LATGTRYVKPKGMHWRTFNALCERIHAAEEEKDAAWMLGSAGLLARMAAHVVKNSPEADTPEMRDLQREFEAMKELRRR
jgi:hypothetical protein